MKKKKKTFAIFFQRRFALFKLTLKMAQLLSGKDVAGEIRNRLKTRVESIRQKDAGFRPGLAIVQVGGREDSNVYIRMKMKAAEEIGINANHVKLPKYE